MLIETLYGCEICGTRYRSRRLAEACEATVLPDCPVKPGDAVSVRERYDGLVPDVVASVDLVVSQEAAMNADLADDHPAVARMLSKARPVFHQWLVQLRNHHQMGKDDMTVLAHLSDLEVDGRRLDEAA